MKYLRLGLFIVYPSVSLSSKDYLAKITQGALHLESSDEILRLSSSVKALCLSLWNCVHRY